MRILKKYQLFLAASAFAFLCIMFIPALPQSLSFHNFADHRNIFDVDNFWNVFSNLPFVIVGIWGLWNVLRSQASVSYRMIYGCLFIGVLLTAIGSAQYHYNPNNDSLIWDRMPMTIVFMSFLSATIAELVSESLGVRLLFPLILLGIGSVIYWHLTEMRGHGDLRMYMFVQFYPMFAIPVLIFMNYDASIKKSLQIIGWVVFWYTIAKLLELWDNSIYRLLPLSGHSLKHIAAAVSTWYFVRLFNIKHLNNA